ncbi:YjbH domain-containing protein [Marinoscillum pacificum]|uniref:YjbH domain-containing protein n=1 Tax=Marinoscillum pacificum TaxID=392723 RepID=UPI0021586888|nr:YjbH domain-containing protein [Marinoscillum pacificum]
MKKLFFLTCLFLFIQYQVPGQSLTGLQGLIVTPSAEMHPNGTFVLGTSYFDHHNFEYGFYEYNGLAGYASLTFLPFVELSFRYTSQIRTISRENRNFPDRMPSFRIRALKESKWLPAVAFGLHDISSVDGGGAKHFEASYLVLTKNFTIIQLNIKANSGYGFGILNAKHHELLGYFGGFTLSHGNFNHLQAIIEYDSRDINAGLKLLLWNHLQLLAVTREMKYLEGSISYRMTMK